MQPVLIHRGNTYKTASNQRVRTVTPSGKVKNIKVAKKAKKHRCHGCNKLMLSIASLRPAAFSRLTLSSRRVTRPYGTTHCGKCVSKKIVSSFLVEEEKLLHKSE
ncbi:large subunit ribosomal protein L34e [Enteropsectra breve]|nr:large subunit ribosomal protein L34e [Enteropsectra breve]KAI5151583.1 large subunit ribosomal protein L34e [Enteropsectra breve]